MFMVNSRMLNKTQSAIFYKLMLLQYVLALLLLFYLKKKINKKNLGSFEMT